MFCIWDLPRAAEIHVAVHFSVSYDAAYKNSIQFFLNDVNHACPQCFFVPLFNNFLN